MNPKIIPAYLSADGGDAHLLYRLDGCEVWAVRRLHGHDSRPWYIRETCGPVPPYWTLVVQTVAGREKSMTLNGGARYYEEIAVDLAGCALRRAVAAAVGYVMAPEHVTRDVGAEMGDGAVAWEPIALAAYERELAARRERRAQHVRRGADEAARRGEAYERYQWNMGSAEPVASWSERELRTDYVRDCDRLYGAELDAFVGAYLAARRARFAAHAAAA